MQCFEEIIQIRKQLGLSQLEMAEKLGNTGPSVSRWESGKVPVPKWALKQYERLLRETPETGGVT